MEFREGMLGVVVVALALTGGMFASYFAGIEGEDREYTDYQYLADVSGLFDYDKSPTFIDYEPSSNYTGYYSEDTGEYWPEEYVDYVPNVNPSTGDQRVNNYRVVKEPTSVTTLNVPLDDLDLDNPMPATVQIVYFENTHNDWVADSISVASLREIIEKMNLPSEINEVYLMSPQNYTENEITSGDVTVNWTLFSTKRMWINHNFVLGSEDDLYIWSDAKFLEEGKKPGYSKQLDPVYRATYYQMILSVMVDLEKGIAKLYSDNNHENFVEQVALDEVVVCYGGGRFVLADKIEFAEDLDLLGWKTNIDYLDPNFGVSMKE